MSDHIFESGKHSALKTWRRIHGNSEETHVFVIEQNGDYLVLAIDVDPREYEPVAAVEIAYEPTPEGAKQRAERWMQNNPKGIASGSGGGSRAAETLKNMLKKANDYGNKQIDEAQNQ